MQPRVKGPVSPLRAEITEPDVQDPPVDLVSKGLEAEENIQVECAVALGRMGSRTACMALEKALDSKNISASAKTCIEALLTVSS